MNKVFTIVVGKLINSGSRVENYHSVWEYQSDAERVAAALTRDYGTELSYQVLSAVPERVQKNSSQVQVKLPGLTKFLTVNNPIYGGL